MITVTKAYRTCGSFPAQWEADTDDGRCIYVRFRCGDFTIGSGATRSEAISNFDDIFGEETSADDGSHGQMEYPEMKRRTAHLINWPKNETLNEPFEPESAP